MQNKVIEALKYAPEELREEALKQMFQGGILVMHSTRVAAESVFDKDFVERVFAEAKAEAEAVAEAAQEISESLNQQ